MHCWLCFCFKSNSNSAAHTTIRWLKIPCHFQDFFLHLKNFRKVLADCFPHFLRMDASAIEMAGNLIKIIADLPKFWNKFLWFGISATSSYFAMTFPLLTDGVCIQRATDRRLLHFLIWSRTGHLWAGGWYGACRLFLVLFLFRKCSVIQWCFFWYSRGVQFVYF